MDTFQYYPPGTCLFMPYKGIQKDVGIIYYGTTVEFTVSIFLVLRELDLCPQDKKNLNRLKKKLLQSLYKNRKQEITEPETQSFLRFLKALEGVVFETSVDTIHHCDRKKMFTQDCLPTRNFVAIPVDFIAGGRKFRFFM